MLVISLMLLLCLGAGSVSAAEGYVRTADAPSSTEESSYPFGEMPDMKLLMQAMEVIGDTPLDSLSEQQLSKLQDLGFDQETLRENADLLKQLIELPPEELSQDEYPVGGMFFPIIGLGTAGLLLIGAGTAVYLHHRRSRR